MLETMLKRLPCYKKIEVIRVMHGWNQIKAADKCSTVQRVYWSWESGKAYPRLSSRKAIADAFGLEIEDIFSALDNVVEVTGT